MDHIEKTLHNYRLSQNINHWYRYEDDILNCYIGTSRLLQTNFNFITEFTQKLNSPWKYRITVRLFYLELTNR